MLLDGEQQPTPTERASPDFQIPGVELAARPCDRAGVDQVFLELRQGFLRSLSLVPPVGHVQAPEPGSGPRATPPPRCQAAPDPARKAGHWLHEMEEHDDEPQHDERPTSLPRARDELRPPRTDRGLRDRQRDGDEQRRPEDDRGAPTDAQDERPRQEADHQIPFRREGQGPPRTSGLVERLERCGAPDSLVDPSTEGRQIGGDAFSIDASEPAQLPDRTVSGRPLPFQEGLGLSVTDLLLPKLPEGSAAVMPYYGGRRVPDDPAPVADPPAHVDVVARAPEPRVESADRLERVFPERHVAPRDVLRDGVGNQDRVRAARGVRDGIRPPTIVRGREVRSSDSDGLAFHERERQKSQPMDFRIGIVVDERDDLSGRGADSDVAPGA